MTDMVEREEVAAMFDRAAKAFWRMAGEYRHDRAERDRILNISARMARAGAALSQSGEG